MIMRKLKKFLCVALATATLVTSVLSPSGQAQAKGKRYSVKGLDVKIGYGRNIKNNNKYPVKVVYLDDCGFDEVLYIKSGDRLVDVDDIYKIKSVTKISNKTYNKNYKKMFNYLGYSIVHPHQHFTVKEGKDYDKLHAKQIKECKELLKQTKEEYEKVDKEVEELHEKCREYARTHSNCGLNNTPYSEECYELEDKRDELKDKKMSLESKYCDLVNSNISPYMYTKDGKRRKTIYSESRFGWHGSKVLDIQLCYKYDKDNDLMPKNKKNFKPFIYVESEAIKDGASLRVKIIAYDKNGNIIKVYNAMSPKNFGWGVCKGTQSSFKFKYPSNMASFDIIPE